MTGPPSYRRLLAFPAPRRLALAAVPADLSDWLDYAAVVSLLVFTWHEGPLVLAIFALALILPYIVAGPLLVALLHGRSARSILIASNLGRAIMTAALMFVGDTTLLLVFVFLRSCVDAVFAPVRQSAVQATTPAAFLTAANGLHQAINQFSKIAGPAIGGLLLEVVSPAGIFGINAALSVLAAAIMATAVIPRGSSESASSSLLQRTFAGFSEIRAHRQLKMAVVFLAVAYGAFYVYDALIALLVEDFGLGSTAFGFLVAASGLGGILGALVAGRMPRVRPMILMATGAGTTGAFAFAMGIAALFGLHVPLWLFLPIMIITGGATGLMLVPYRVVVQTAVAADRIAAVYAAGEAVSVVAMLAAPFIGSAFAIAWGTGAAFVAGGAALLLLLAWTTLRRADSSAFTP